MKRLRVLLVLLAAVALVASSVALTAAGNAASGGTVTAATGDGVDTSLALVQLNGDPLSTYVKTKPAHGKKIDFSNTSVKSYRAQLSALRNDFKQWLQANAPKAKITGSWDIALNAVSVQLNGTTLDKLATSPQVKHVEYEGLYHPTYDDIDLTLVNALDAWTSVGGSANAGAGIKVGIIDTGIDQTHPCFDDAGYPPADQLGDTTFTNNKVIVARVFNNKTPSRHWTPEALQEHGTHVAGTVACNANTAATVDDATVPFGISGVAPAALLGNYNIFPGAEADGGITNAPSESILNALEAAYMDGMDIVNMSLGGGHAGIKDLLTMAVDDLDQANMLSAVAAGNSGDGNTTDHPYFPPGHFTIESPGSAARALTAGASTVGHLVMSLVEQGSAVYASDRGEFAFPSSDLTAATVEAEGTPVPLVNNHKDGCGTYAAPVTGKIVLVARGTCSFSEKGFYAEEAGAVGVIVVNRDPVAIPMGTTAGFPVTIPMVMVGKADGLVLYGNIPANVTITPPTYVSQLDPNPAIAALAPESNVQADFSSQGPTDVDFRVKPDVMAPGVNVLSSIPHQFCAAPPCFAFFQGTSMATPHLAGAAAVVKGAHPDWSAAQIRSAIVNTAAQGEITSFTNGSVVTDPNITGAGLLDVDAAVHASVAIDPVSVSFGAVPSGSGNSLTYAVQITNITGSSKTYGFAATSSTGTGVSYSLSTSSLTLAAGASDWVIVTMTSAKGSSGGQHYATLNVTVGATNVAHAVLYTLIK